MTKRNLDMRYFALTALAGSILCLNQATYALQAMADHDLRQIDGQDGVSINTQYGNIDIDELYWEDKAGTAGNAEIALKASAKDVKIRKNTNYVAPVGTTYELGTEYKINVGANATGQTGIDLKLTSQPSTISVDNFQICEGVTCESINGRLAIQIGSPIDISLITTDGLFNKNAQAELGIGVKNVNIFTGLPVAPAATTYNQLIFKNSNFNFYGKGVVYVDDVEGFVLNTNTGGTTVKAPKAGSLTPAQQLQYGYVDFTRTALPNSEQVAGANGASTSTYYLNVDSNGNMVSTGGTAKATGAGLNLEFMTKTGAMDNASLSSTGAKGLIRVGASGRMVNSFLQIRGTDASTFAAADSVLGYASNASGTANTVPNNTLGNNKTVMGSTGIALRLRGEFTRDGDAMLFGDNNKSTKLEIGGAGTNTFGFEFSELSPLISNSNERAYFDSGNVYINLAKTQHLQMPANQVLNSSRFGGKTNEYLTKADDYIQQIHQRTAAEGNPRSVVVAIRGADFQAISRRGRFTSSHNMADTANIISPTAGLTNQWGLGLPFYNLNSNIALYTTTYTGSYYTLNSSQQVTAVPITSASDRLGFALALSVQGKSTDDTKTTSIMVVDAANNMYIGLRNIDMLLRGYGTFGLEGGQVNVDLPNLLMVMSAEVAGGFFPTYVNPSNPSAGINNPFNSDKDILFGLKLKLLGDMNFSLIPNNEIGPNGNRLSIVGRYNLLKGGGSTIQISDPIDNSMIGLDNIEGPLGFNNAIVVNKDTVGFNYSFEFNPATGQTPAQREQNVFRVRDINLYPPLALANNRGQRLGEMVMTGGRLSTEMAIKPRN